MNNVSFVRQRIAYVIVAIALFVAGGSYRLYSDYRVSSSDPTLCDIPGMSGSSKVVGNTATLATTSFLQDPGQDPETQGHKPNDKLCERPDPKNPDKGYKDPNKVGCKCMRKTDCQYTGNREDPGKAEDHFATRCKNYCFKDRCSCPDPCKT